MFRNYFLIAWRAALRDKSYTVLNIVGLTIGIACSALIFLFVFDELTYDRSHEKSANLYRLNAAYHLPNNGGFEQWAASGSAVAEILTKDFPEVKQAVRVRKLADIMMQKASSDERFYETVFAADSNFFDVFTFHFLAGNPQNALLDQHSIVVTERMAQKYFSTTDAVGKSIYLPKDSTELKITGVIENYPPNTHLKTDMIISIETLRTAMHAQLDNWWNFSYHTYVELSPGASMKTFEDKVKFVSRKYIPDQEDKSGYKQEFSVIPFSKIHLYSNLRSEIEANSKASYVYIFLIIGIFILVIACINFMNLATARSAKRAKEIGLRKVVGAFRGQLISQFLSEAFIMTSVAVVLAVVICAFAVRLMNDVTGKELEVLTNRNFWPILLIICLFVSVLAGSYPSFFLSAFKPVDTLKGNFKSSSKGNILRKALVIFQFSISIFLIAGTLVVYRHLTFLRNVDLGFNKEKIVFIPARGNSNDFRVLKDEVEKLSGIEDATLSSRVPGKEMGNNVVRIGWDEKATWSDMRFLAVDYDYIENYDLKLVEGRAFDESRPSDEMQAFILNESAVRRLGFNSAKEALGQKLWWQNRKGEVVGVLKDFHFMSANTSIEPFIMVMNTSWSVQFLSVKLEAGDPSRSISQIEKLFHSIVPGQIFEYQFLDEDFDKQYKSEEKFMNVFTFFAVVAIVIAALGLYGLALFMTELKVTELGIRKVLGATEGNLIYLLTSNFLMLVLISFIIAGPLAYYVMNEWLQQFPMRENLNIGLLIFAGVLAFTIALLTVSYQSIKAARANPIKAIRNQT
jgi:putative ABC transport system permease protein